VKRLTAWIGGTAVGIAAYRLLKRRPEPGTEPAPAGADDRAEELRAKLADSRSADTVVEQAPAETEAESVMEPEPESPEERRRRVHEEGRSTLDDMKSE